MTVLAEDRALLGGPHGDLIESARSAANRVYWGQRTPVVPFDKARLRGGSLRSNSIIPTRQAPQEASAAGPPVESPELIQRRIRHCLRECSFQPL
jgi:hypothetical protein